MFCFCFLFFSLVWLFLSYTLLFSLTYLVRTYRAAPAGFALRWISVTQLSECLFQEKQVASASVTVAYQWLTSRPSSRTFTVETSYLSFSPRWVIGVDETRDRDVRIEMWHFLSSLPFHMSFQLFVNHSCPTESISFVTNNMKRYFINNSAYPFTYS